MATISDLLQPADWNFLWSGLKDPSAPHLLVFKFSPRCPVSHSVERISRGHIKDLPDVPGLKIVAVDVVNSRPTSQQIAADTSVRHESPQALLLAPGQKVLWHASHESIDTDALDAALKPVAKA